MDMVAIGRVVLTSRERDAERSARLRNRSGVIF
jgi:hypothetical protein